MKFIMHRFLLHNERICETTDKVLSPGQVGLLSGWGVFSTLRVAGGVLFAWERHWARMKRDATLLRVPFPEDSRDVRARLLSLVRANNAGNAVMRVSVVRNRGRFWQAPGVERAYDLIAFTADLTDWGRGVRLAVAPQARHAASMFAGAKILSWGVNLALLEDAQSRGFDEVILLNEHGEVSECTSANIFIVEGDHVFTPPLQSGCLPGVTRDVLLTEIAVAGIEIGERTLRVSDLERADEVLITSSTRNLLPVVSIEGVPLPRGAVGPSLQKAFQNYTDRYVAAHKTDAIPAASG
jgi:branched-subunit amino acid aminotransferase/4-amino-4-deoxychorismate lyase